MTQSREEQYRLDDLVSRIWAVCVDTHFHYDGLPNDEDCGVDAAILAKEACAKIKELIQASQPEQTATPLDEVAWLIERKGLCLGFCEYKFRWVTFTDENALRFSRERDAYSFKETMRWENKDWEVLTEAKVTEHLWSAAAPLDEQLREVLCERCLGTGIYSGDDALPEEAPPNPCSVCKGKGRIVPAAPAEVTAEQLCEVFVEMSDGIMWKEPEADGHFYRAAKKLNALLAAAKGGRQNE